MKADLRRFDRDRYLTALFAAPDRRAALFALYAFNLEIARARESVREPMMGRMRLQWWREAIGEIYDGRIRPHPVAESLAPAIAARRLPREQFDGLIDARERDMEDTPPADLGQLIDYADATSGSLVRLALQILGADMGSPAIAATARRIGIAWALTGLLRAVPFHARARRLYLPTDLMERAGASRRELFELRGSPALAAVAGEVAETARRHIRAARLGGSRAPRALLPALLPATLAEGYLRRMRRAGFDVFDPLVQDAPPGRIWRLALMFALGRF